MPDKNEIEGLPPEADEYLEKIKAVNNWLNGVPEFADLAHSVAIMQTAWRAAKTDDTLERPELERILEWLRSWYINGAIINMLVCGTIGVKYPEGDTEPSFSRPEDGGGENNEESPTPDD